MLSVVIPVKNGMPYIKIAIESVLSAKIENMEIVVSDDNSTDGTSDYLKTLTDPRIKIVGPREPMPVDQHWTFAVQCAKGQFTKLLCADDLVEPSGLERQLEAIKSVENIDLVVSSRRIINAKGRTLIRKHGRAGYLGIKEGQEVLRKCFVKGTNILGEPSGLIFRTDKLLLQMPWNGKNPYMLDMELYARLLPNINVVFLDSVDSAFRVHGKSISGKTRKLHAMQFNSLYKEAIQKGYLRQPLNLSEIIRFRIMTILITQARNIVFILANNRKL